MTVSLVFTPEIVENDIDKKLLLTPEQVALYDTDWDVSADVTSPTPAITSGPSDRWSPAEGGDIENLYVTVRGTTTVVPDVLVDEFDDRIYDLLWEKFAEDSVDPRY